MFKVFLVDDEIVIREGIRNGFPWDETQFTLCGEAPDGEMAYPMIADLKPDILITDIRMPFMDGLTLSRKVTKTLPWINIIILSGYDDFKYAQQAIDIGVKQYLLKPVTPRKLEEVLNATAVNIQKTRERQADTTALQPELASSEGRAREQFLARLLEGRAGANCKAEAAALGVRLEASRYLVLMLGAVEPEARLGLMGCLNRVVEREEVGVWCTSLLESPALLMSQPKEEADSPEALEERAYALAQTLEYEAKAGGIRLPAVAIGSPVSRLADLPQALASARAVLTSVEGQPPRIVGFLDVDLSATLGQVEGSALPLYERLLYAARKDGANIAKEVFCSLGELAPQSILVLNYLLMDVLLAVTRIIRQCGGDPSAVLPARLMQQTELIKLAQQPSRALEAGQEMIDLALAYRDRNVISRYGEILRQARDYIESNVHRPDMTLQDVAGHVALSNNHFSTVFSQEMGLTFTEYVTKVRLDRAKHLLSSTSCRSVEIAAAIGYSDPHYFSYLFKKQVGLSPRDFRKSLSPEP
ncbi:MAG: response regulator [Bacillota bacterium]|nr:response regulator [Bacillota bacterium]